MKFVIKLEDALFLKEIENSIDKNRLNNEKRFYKGIERYKEVLKNLNVREQEYSYDLHYKSLLRVID
jgi:hypothetical protein